MHVIIPVAGKGTRLRPHTHTTPKPLLHVAGKSVLHHILDRLQGLPIDDLILITGHLGEQFNELKTAYPVHSVEQTEQKGTAHAINLAKPFVKGPVLIVFADTVFDTDLSVITKTDADGVIWAKEVEDYQRFGVVVHENGIMKRIVEKPTEPVSKLANIGLYYIADSKALFDGIERVMKNKPGKGGEYFLTDAFQDMIDHGKTIRVEPVQGWYDCGTWEDLIATNKVLLANNSKSREYAGSVIIPPVWIEDGVEIKSSVIGPNVSVGAGSVIENSIIKDSILNIKSQVSRANIENSILSEGAQVAGSPKKVNLGSHSQMSL